MGAVLCCCVPAVNRGTKGGAAAADAVALAACVCDDTGAAAVFVFTAVGSVDVAVVFAVVFVAAVVFVFTVGSVDDA